MRRIFVTAWIIWLADFVTKSWALTHLNTQPKEIIGSLLQLTLVRNSGAAFSFAAGLTLVFSFLSVAVTAVIFFYSRLITSQGWKNVLGLLLGGVSGNLTDRIFREPYFLSGHVIDWIQIPHWPVFNIADIAISTAAVIAFILSARNITPIARVQ